ncbi:MAG TPA: CHAT domain-containing protein, partial [Actinokineospora sp.]|nr:CHAT domain-containing protein [Actinokineospora sp.]
MTWSHHHTHALLHQERGEPFLAKTHARRARSLATTTSQAAESELVLAWICQQLGDHIAAAGLIASARPNLPEPLRGRADCLTGLAHCVKAEHAESLAVLTRAAVALEPHWKANALVAIGVSAGYLRRFDTANKALDEARAIYLSLAKVERAATCLHNKGFVAAQAGDFARALKLYAEAGIDETHRPEVLIDKANALLGVGSVSEAGHALARAAKLLGAAGRGPDFAEATLSHAKCALRAGDNDAAARSAASAAEMFESQGRPGWSARARAIGAQAAGTPSPRLAAACERAGWHTEAAELHLLAGRPDLVEPHRNSASAELRGLGWLAATRTATSSRGVLAACRAGLRIPAQEPRLAVAGLDAVLRDGDPRTVFAWVERRRGTAAEPGEVAAALAERAMVSLFVHKRRVMAVSVVAKHFQVHDLADEEYAVATVTALRRGSALSARTGQGSGAGAVAVDDLLLAPLRRAIGDRELVVVSDLEVLWPALPSCLGRPVAVAPSAAWVGADRAESGSGHAVWVAGPELAHARGEVTDLRARHGGVALTDDHATVDGVIAAIDGARMVHVAAHGRFGPALALADGLLREADFGSVTVLPHHVVLAACESAGLASPLLARGVAAVIAGVLPVPDERTGGLMRALHAGIARGQRPVEALAAAQAVHGHLGFTDGLELCRE